MYNSEGLKRFYFKYQTWVLSEFSLNDGQQKFAIQCNNSLHYASDVEVEITVIYHFPRVFNSCHDFVNTTADKIFSYKLISKSKRIN